MIFSSDVALSTAAPSAPGLYEWSAGKPPAEALQLVSVLPGNKKAAPDEPEPQLGDLNPAGSSAQERGLRRRLARVLERDHRRKGSRSHASVHA